MQNQSFNPFENATIAFSRRKAKDKRVYSFIYFDSAPRKASTGIQRNTHICGGTFKRISIYPLMYKCDGCGKIKAPKGDICDGCGRRAVSKAKPPKYEYVDHYCEKCSKIAVVNRKRIGQE